MDPGLTLKNARCHTDYGDKGMKFLIYINFVTAVNQIGVHSSQ